MNPVSRKAVWALAGAGAAILAETVVEQSLDAGWRAIRHEEPPRDPHVTDYGWREAIFWAMGSAALVGVAQLLARQGAAAGWKRVTGKRPPQRRRRR
jgi:hypothetical protein